MYDLVVKTDIGILEYYNYDLESVIKLVQYFRELGFDPQVTGKDNTEEINNE